MKEPTHIATIIKMVGHNVTLRLHNAGEGCDGCAMSMLCNKPEIVTVSASETSGLELGDRVMLKATGRSRTFSIAMLLGAPLALLLGCLALGTALGWGDEMGAMCGIGLCGLWYGMLSLFRKTIRRGVKFEISHKKDQ